MKTDRTARHSDGIGVPYAAPPLDGPLVIRLPLDNVVMFRGNRARELYELLYPGRGGDGHWVCPELGLEVVAVIKLDHEQKWARVGFVRWKRNWGDYAQIWKPLVLGLMDYQDYARVRAWVDKQVED